MASTALKLTKAADFFSYHSFLWSLNFSYSGLLAKHRILLCCSLRSQILLYTYAHSGLRSENTFSVRPSVINFQNFACSLPQRNALIRYPFISLIAHIIRYYLYSFITLFFFMVCSTSNRNRNLVRFVAA